MFKFTQQLSSLSKTLVFKKSYLQPIRKNFSSGPDHHGPKVRISAPRITERIVWINIDNNGRFERIAAFEGESLLESFQRYKVDNIPGTCEGGEDINKMTEKPIDPMTYGPFCAGCHVIIADPWRGQMGELHYLEERNLEEASYPITPNSRLACCFLVEKWMNEMIITIGPQENVLEETN